MITRSRARQAAEILTAYADGKEIQCLDNMTRKWRTTATPVFNFADFEYRVKPETRVIYVNEYGGRLGANYYKAPSEAASNATEECTRVAVKFMEVIED